MVLKVSGTEQPKLSGALADCPTVCGASLYCLATAPDFSLAATPGNGVLLRLRRSGHLMTWTQSDLLKEAPNAATEVENRAIELAGGAERFRT